MDYISFLSDRTDLFLSDSSAIDTSLESNESDRENYQGVRSIWEVLLSIPADVLKRISRADLKQHNYATQYSVGEGVSFQVGRVLWTDETLKSKALAIKYLKSPEAGGNNEDLQALVKELRILTSEPLRECENVAQLFGYGCESKEGKLTVYVLMEYAKFGDMRSFVRERGKSLTLTTRAKICGDVARGLDSLHSYGIVQGDVKLENALVFAHEQQEFIVKLSDFGSAITEDSSIYYGTSIYNAPEIRDRGNIQYQYLEELKRCDIFSFGLLVWETSIDGNRYFENFENPSDILNVLPTLPRNELQRLAIKSIGDTAADKISSRVLLQRILKATLCDAPEERAEIKSLLDIFNTEKLVIGEDKRGLVKKMYRTDMPSLPNDPLKFFRILPHTTSTNTRSFSSDQIALRSETVNPSYMNLPPEMEKEVFMQMKLAVDNAQSKNDITLAKTQYGLSHAYLSGLGTAVDTDLMLLHLREAARLGHHTAAAVCARYHDALGHAVPPEIALCHPLIGAESHLREYRSEEYYSQRLKLHEREMQAAVKRLPFELQWNHDKKSLVFHFSEELQICEFLKYMPKSVLQASVVFEEDSIEENLDHYGDSGYGRVITNSMVLNKKLGNLLHYASRLGLLQLLELLLNAGCDPNQRSQNRNTPLILACMGGHQGTVKLLLSHRANAQLKGEGRLSCLHWLWMFKDEDIPEIGSLLLNGGCSLHHSSKTGLTLQDHGLEVNEGPLHFAVAARNLKAVEFLLEMEKQPKLACELGSPLTPLTIAVLNRYPEIVKMLIAYQNKNNVELTPGILGPLMLAKSEQQLLIHGSRAMARQALEATVDEIIASATDFEIKGKDSLNTLSFAIKSSYFTLDMDILEVLIEKGARLDFVSGVSQYLNVIAERTPVLQRQITKLLLSLDVLPQAEELLLFAASQGTTAVVEALLEHGIDPNQQLPSISYSALQLAACCANNVDVIRLLLDYGADIDCRFTDQEDRRSEMLNIVSQFLDEDIGLPASVVEQLRSDALRAADGKSARAEGLSALETSVLVNFVDLNSVNLLVQRGAKVADETSTILHTAASSNGFAEGQHILIHLLKYDHIRALLDTNDPQGRRPLTIACSKNNYPAVLALLHEGASTDTIFGTGSLIDDMCFSYRQLYMNFEWHVEKDSQNTVVPKNSERIVEALLDRTRPLHNYSPLHLAALLTNFDLVRSLVEKGDDLFVKNEHGETPLDVVQSVIIVDSTKLDENADVGDEDSVNGEEYGESALGTEDDDNIKIEDERKSLYLEIDKACTERKEKIINYLKEKMSTVLLFAAEIPRQATSFPDLTLDQYQQKVEIDIQQLSEKGARADSSEMLTTKLRLVDILTTQNKPQESVPILYELLKSSEELLPPHHYNCLYIRTEISGGLRNQGREDEARQMAEETLKIASDTQEPNDPGRILSELALCYIDLFLSSESRAPLEAQIPLLERLTSALGSLHCEVIVSSLNLASTHFILGDCTESKELILDAIRKLPEMVVADKGHDKYMIIILEILRHGVDMVTTAKYEDAEVVFSALHRQSCRLRGAWAKISTAVHEELIAVLKKQGKYEIASEEMAKKIKALENKSDTSSTNIAKAKLDLAELYELQSRWIEAEILENQAIYELEKVYGATDEEILKAKTMLCLNWQEQKRYIQAEVLARENWIVYMESFGAQNASTLAAQRQLTMILDYLLRHEESLKHREELLRLNIEKYTESSIEAATAMVDLSVSYKLLKVWDKSEDFAKNALEIYTKVLGPEHYTTLFSMRMLALSYFDSGRFQEASGHYRSTLDLERKLLGDKSSEALETMHSLSICYFDMQQYKEAAELQRGILEIRKEARATSDSPNLAIANAETLLGQTYRELKNFEAAEPLLMSSVETSEQLLGELDRDSIERVVSLASLYYSQEKWTLSYPWARKALERSAQAFGEDDDMTLEALHFMTDLEVNLGDYTSAEMSVRRMVKLLKAKRGENDRKTIDAMSQLSFVCTQVGLIDEANDLIRKVYKQREIDLGPTHEDTIEAMSALVVVLSELEEDEEMLEITRTILASRQATLPDTDDKVLVAKTGMSVALCNLERYEEAVLLSQQVLDSRTKTLGLEHKSTVEAMQSLANIYTNQENYEDAQTLLVTAVDSQRKIFTAASSEEEIRETQIQLLDMIDDLTQVYINQKRWVDIEPLAIELVNGWDKYPNQGHHQRLITALRTLKQAYIGLGRRQDARDVITEIKKELEEVKKAKNMRLRKFLIEEKSEELQSALAELSDRPGGVSDYMDELEEGGENFESAGELVDQYLWTVITGTPRG